jgi:hypothetical protein
MQTQYTAQRPATCKATHCTQAGIQCIQENRFRNAYQWAKLIQFLLFNIILVSMPRPPNWSIHLKIYKQCAMSSTCPICPLNSSFLMSSSSQHLLETTLHYTFLTLPCYPLSPIPTYSPVAL